MDSKEVKTFVIFDTETTGLPSPGNNPKITELCFIAITRDELVTKQTAPRVLNKLSICINPGKRINHVSSQITGLHNDALESMPSFERQASLVTTFLKNLPQPACLVAHNGNGFDFPLIVSELQKAAEDIPDVLCADSLEAFRMFDGLPPVPEHVLKKRQGMNGHVPAAERPTCKLKSEDTIDPACLNNKDVELLASVHPEIEQVKKRISETSTTILEAGIKQEKKACLEREIWKSNEITPEKVPAIGDTTPGAPRKQSDRKLLRSERTDDSEVRRSLFSGQIKDGDEISNDDNHGSDIIVKNEKPDQCQSLPVASDTHSLSHDKPGHETVLRSCDEAQSTFVSTETPQSLTESEIEMMIVVTEAETNLSDKQLEHQSDGKKASSNPQFNKLSSNSGFQNCKTVDVAESSEAHHLQVVGSAEINKTSEAAKNLVEKRSNLNGEEKDDAYTKVIKAHKEVKVSYSLSSVYGRMFGQQPEVAHTAEDDCLTLLRIIYNKSHVFPQWSDQHALSLRDVKPMY